MNCGVIRDLLPLYADGVAGDETRALVEQHLETCAGCREELARMRAAVEADAADDAGFGRALQRQKRRRTRRTVLLIAAAVVLGAAVCLGILWSRGVFHIVDRQTSPDGTVTTTVYSRNVTGAFPTAGDCTLRDSGAVRGSTVYGGTFDGLWWSPDGRYQVVSVVDGGRVQLWFHNYSRNSGGNLTAWVSMAVQSAGWFPDAPVSEMEWPDVEYRFLQWAEAGGTMLLRYDYVDTGGVDRAGYFWYDCETGQVRGAMELPTAVARGTVLDTGRRIDGTEFFTMALDELDGNGNVVEFVALVPDTAQLRGLETVEKDDRVAVVYRESTALQHAAVSVTAIP